MFKRRYAALLPALILLSACSSKPKTEAAVQTAGAPSGGFLRAQYDADGGDFANNPAAEQFIDKMVNKHGFDRQQLHEILSQAKRLDYVLRLMDRQAPSAQVPTGPNGAWLRYRKQFITPDNVQNGVVFWNQYEDALNRAWQVTACRLKSSSALLVETRWGRVMGKTRILDALATLSFNYRVVPSTSSELETFLLMARNEQDDPLDLKGSFAGAMGYGRLCPLPTNSMPSTLTEMVTSTCGIRWMPSAAWRTTSRHTAGRRVGGLPCRLTAKRLVWKTASKPLAQLTAAGLTPTQPLGNVDQVSLLRLDVGTGYQYWYGMPNFYTITRYNHSTHYAMAVWQLGRRYARVPAASPFSQ